MSMAIRDAMNRFAWIEPTNEPSAIIWRHHESKHPINVITTRSGLRSRVETFAQENIAINHNSSKTIILTLGFRLNRGIVFVSLKNDLKKKMLSLHDGVIVESVENIIITVTNNSDSLVTINDGESLCFVTHVNNDYV